MDTGDLNDAYTVRSLDDLAKIYAKPLPKIATKATAHITEVGRAFIVASPFLVLATSNGDSIDCSPKGDAPGFVMVLDERHLVIPDRPGNKRFDGMRNILENPHVGLIFFVPGREETLRVNGRATITRAPALLDRMEVGGKRPTLAIGVEVEEVFMHCAKAFKRSGLWHPDKWPDTSTMAPAACMLFDHAKPTDQTVEELARRLEIAYVKTLY